MIVVKESEIGCSEEEAEEILEEIYENRCVKCGTYMGEIVFVDIAGASRYGVFCPVCFWGVE